MNKFKLLLAAFSLVIIFGLAQGALAKGLVLGLSETNLDISSILKMGSTGEEVSKLQDFLIDSEYLRIEEPTGYFGTQTEEAVKKLQDNVGLKPDGIVGEQTKIFFKVDTITDIITKDNTATDDITTNEIRDCGEGDKFSQLTGKPCLEDKEGEVVSKVPGCDSAEYIFSPLSGDRCDGRDSTDDREEDVRDDSLDDDVDESDVSDDSNSGDRALGRIMFWYGKVNQHTDSIGNWQTDPDGVSGAGTYAQFGEEGYGDRKLEYCQKFYPETKSFVAYEMETISTWKERGNVNNWTSTKLSYLCLE